MAETLDLDDILYSDTKLTACCPQKKTNFLSIELRTRDIQGNRKIEINLSRHEIAQLMDFLTRNYDSQE